MEAKTHLHLPTTEESIIVERVLRIVSSVRGAKPDYARLAAELEPAMPFDIFGVVLLWHDREAVRIIACERRAGAWFSNYHQHPLQGSKVEQLLHQLSSAPAVEPLPEISNYPRGLDGLPAQCGDALSNYHQVRSTFIAPLMVEDRLLGTLELGSTGLHTYDEETLRRLIEGVVRVIATAIEGAQVGGSVEIQNRQRQALRDVSSALTSTTDLSLILNKIVDGVVQALNVSSAIVMLNQREGVLRVEAQQGVDDVLFRQLMRQKAILSEHSIIGYSLLTRQPCVSQDIAADTRFSQNRQFATELGIHSMYSYPLVTGNTVYGALLLCSHEAGGFTPLKIEILSLFASQATIAIHNGMLVESAHQRSRFQEAIEQLEQASDDEGDEGFEREAFERVRWETEDTFGIRFSSLLRFISDHLLTRSERDLHTMLYREAIPVQGYVEGHVHVENEAGSASDVPIEGVQMPLAFAPFSRGESIALLTHTAETALARVAAMSELGGLLMQLQQTTGLANAAWFVTDPQGHYLSMNASAELFCGMRNDTIDVDRDSTLEDIFARLLSRIRDEETVRSYLREFVQEEHEEQEQRQGLRCVIALNAESVKKTTGRIYQPPNARTHPLSHSQPDTTVTDQYYQLMRYPLNNAQGLLVGRVLLVHDVTAQVRDEKNKAALLASVSHDLRTPLTTIKAAVSGLMGTNMTWDEATYREILEDINAESDHLEVLVTDLIEMSRIEMGALVLEKEWCDILEVLYGAVARMESVVGERTLLFRTDSGFQSELPLVNADHVQLERAFFYLMKYVVHDTEEIVEILANVGVVEIEEVTYMRVQMIDCGKGIPVEERERLLKTFYRSKMHSNGHTYGSGLGLAICRGIVDAHQGHMYVEAFSDDQTRSCFTCILPLHQQNGIAREQHTAAIHLSSKRGYLPEESHS
ncbi:MAG: GAF domain-containing protein [Ktedonobacteraceae bacterium]